MNTIIAFFVLRLVIAWFFLQPIPALCRHWKASVAMVKLVFPTYTKFFTAMMIVVMVCGALSVLLGFYAEIGAAMLCIYSLIGFFVHSELKQQIEKLKLKDRVTDKDEKAFEKCQSLGVVGHATSAQKNIVIAAVLLLIVLMGSGSYSLTGGLW